MYREQRSHATHRCLAESHQWLHMRVARTPPTPTNHVVRHRTLICGTVRVVSYHWLSKVHELFLSKIFDWHDANQLGLFQCFHLHIESQSSAKPACLEHRTNMANDGCTVKKSRALQICPENIKKKRTATTERACRGRGHAV